MRHGFYFILIYMEHMHIQVLLIVSCFILGFGFRWWEIPVWLWK